MASFRCYDNFDVIETLIITSFHLYLIQPCSPPAIIFFIIFFLFFFFFFIATEFILKRRRYWPWITAPSHKCNNKLDCFLHEMLLITDSFFKKTKFARTFKKCFLSAVFESRKYIFFLSLLRDYWFLLFFQFQHLEVLFFVFIMDCLD